MDLRFELDNCFCDYSLAYVYGRKLEGEDFWPENEHDYVVFGVKQSQRPRFDLFWEKFTQQLGHQLERYHVKETVRLPRGYVLKERVYFLPIKSAELLLSNFDRLAAEVFGSAAN